MGDRLVQGQRPVSQVGLNWWLGLVFYGFGSEALVLVEGTRETTPNHQTNSWKEAERDCLQAPSMQFSTLDIARLKSLRVNHRSPQNGLPW